MYKQSILEISFRPAGREAVCSDRLSADGRPAERTAEDVRTAQAETLYIKMYETVHELHPNTDRNMSIFKANLSPFWHLLRSTGFYYSPVTRNVRVCHHTDMSECPVINMRRLQQRWTWSQQYSCCWVCGFLSDSCTLCRFLQPFSSSGFKNVCFDFRERVAFVTL